MVRLAWAPPNWVIGPEWNVLFVLMAISFYLIWTAADGPEKKWAMQIYLVPLVLKATWSSIFFDLRSVWAGAVVIVILWVFILMTPLSFRSISKPVTWMLVPYITWATMAGSVNFGSWAFDRP